MATAAAAAAAARGKPPVAASAAADKAADGAGGEPRPPPRPRFLSVAVHEARALLAKDYETRGSDPFVKVTLGPHAQKTRVICKSLNPMWQQRLLFPLDGLDEGAPLLVEVLERDPWSGLEFLGQVVMTLGKALQLADNSNGGGPPPSSSTTPAPPPSGGGAGWLQLSKRRATDAVAGAVRLSFELLDAAAHVLALADAAQSADPVGVAARLSPCALRIQLHGLSGLRASGMADPLPPINSSSSSTINNSSSSSSSSNSNNVGDPPAVRSRTRATSLLLRYGRLRLEHPLPQRCDPAPAGATTNTSGFDVAIEEEVVVPLAPALLAGNRLARRMKQLHDIKISLKAGDITLAKTQIPVWDVPHAPLPEPAAAAAAGTAAAAEPELGDFAADSRSWLEKNGEPAISSSCTTPRCGTPRAGEPPAEQRASSFRIPACRSDGSFLGSRGLSFMATRPSSPTDLTKRFRSVLSVDAMAPSQPEWAPLRSPSPAAAAAAAAPAAAQGLAAGGGGDLSAGQQVSSKLYRRLMDWRRVPVSAGAAPPVEVAVSLSLESAMPTVVRLGGATNVVGLGEQMCTDDRFDDGEPVDKPCVSASPAPAALATSLVDVDVDMDVDKLFTTLFSSSSGFMTKHWSTEGLRNFEATPWTGADDQGGLGSRSLAYVKPLRIPIPLAPKQCNVWEKQSILSRSDEGFVVLCQSSNDAPKGDCFHVLVQLYGVRLASGRSRLRITMEMVFTKSCLGRGMIQQGAEADARRGWRALADSLRQGADSVVGGNPSVLSAAAAAAASDQIAQQQQQQVQISQYQTLSVITSPNNPALLFVSSLEFERVVAVIQLLILLAILASICYLGFKIDRRLSMLEHVCRA